MTRQCLEEILQSKLFRWTHPKICVQRKMQVPTTEPNDIPEICHFFDTSTIFYRHQKHTNSRLFDTEKTQNSWFYTKTLNSHFLWHRPENFDTSTASGASDKFQVCQMNGWPHNNLAANSTPNQCSGLASLWLSLARSSAPQISLPCWCRPQSCQPAGPCLD